MQKVTYLVMASLVDFTKRVSLYENFSCDKDDLNFLFIVTFTVCSCTFFLYDNVFIEIKSLSLPFLIQINRQPPSQVPP